MYKIRNKTFSKMPLEETEQEELVRYLVSKKIDHHANVNENNQSFSNRRAAKTIEAKAKRMGKRKGVSDLTIFFKTKMIYIELKRQKPILKNGKRGTPSNKPTKDQLEFIEEKSKYKYCDGFIAYGCDEAIEIIKKELV